MHSIEEYVNPKWHNLCQTCAAELCRDFNISPFESDLSHHFSATPQLSNHQALTNWVAKYWLQERYSVLYIDPYLSNELNLALSRELADIDYWALYSLEVKS